jgi:hypothetical protein
MFLLIMMFWTRPRSQKAYLVVRDARYLRLIIQEINAPAVKPAANVDATISIG